MAAAWCIAGPPGGAAHEEDAKDEQKWTKKFKSAGGVVTQPAPSIGGIHIGVVNVNCPTAGPGSATASGPQMNAAVADVQQSTAAVSAAMTTIHSHSHNHVGDITVILNSSSSSGGASPAVAVGTAGGVAFNNSFNTFNSYNANSGNVVTYNRVAM
jgi:hypothetical protein